MLNRLPGPCEEHVFLNDSQLNTQNSKLAMPRPYLPFCKGHHRRICQG